MVTGKLKEIWGIYGGLNATAVVVGMEFMRDKLTDQMFSAIIFDNFACRVRFAVKEVDFGYIWACIRTDLICLNI